MKPVKSDVSFPSLEENILKFWGANALMEKGLEANRGKRPFLFYDGPPFATGLPHYGHILAGTLKDIIPRYWVMKGRYVQRRWGWDCHGVPVEFEMEKELDLKGLSDVEKFGVANFNEACRGIVLRYTQEWEKVILRTGRWVDFKNSYRTMDTSFMESVWWVFRQLWDKGLVYEGFRVVPYSWRISTPLSNFEAGLNYKEVQDPALTVKFQSTRGPRKLLAWTTTPWTLPSNLALAVHPDIKYVEIEDVATHEHFVLAEGRLGSYYKDPSEYRVVKEQMGRELEGETYEPLFPYFSAMKSQGAFRVVLGEYVTTTDGTGIVHTAPAFGEEDFQVAAKYGIPLANPVDAEGRFTEPVKEYLGQQVKDADKNVIRDLKARGVVFRHDTVLHNYPFCWRSDTPLIYRAIPAWYVKLEPLKARLVAHNKTTHWVPEHLRDGRFGNWLENARDWNISRNRFWGTPIPLWRCTANCGELVCVGSIDELEKRTGKRPTDLHKHFIDDLEMACPKCAKPMRRIPEIMDCWFESGSMPYGQAHYPFENREAFEKSFPADFIAEGIDQTRGWFYTLCVLAGALFDKPPFKNVIVNGLILAEDGKKMSKSLRNFPDPRYLLDTYGADALRAYLMSSPASHAEDLRFSEAGVKEIVRSVLLPLWNAYSFFTTYAVADGWDPGSFKASSIDQLDQDLDRWVVSRLQTLVREVDAKMAEYHLYEVVPKVIDFIDELTNWYIRLNRRRFWREEKGKDKDNAYATLYYVLTEFGKVLAPILPYITEEIYQNLEAGTGRPESVHLCSFPEFRESRAMPELEAEMNLIRKVVSMGRLLRTNSKLKTRQPLKEILIITRNPRDKQSVEKYRDLIAHELNVKKVSFSSDESQWVRLTAKPNAKVLGPRLGARMKQFFATLKQLPHEELAKLDAVGFVEVDGEKFTPEELGVERQARQAGMIESSGGCTVWLDTSLDDALIAEGRARELVNRIQKLRKDLGFEVTDRIRVGYQCAAEIQSAIQHHRQYISDEVLAETLAERPGQVEWSFEQEIDGFPVKVHVERC